MLGHEQETVEVSLLEPDPAGVGAAALWACGGLRNPWLHKGSPVCRLHGWHDCQLPPPGAGPMLPRPPGQGKGTVITIPYGQGKRINDESHG
jgi:hypothetical protein